MIFLGQGKKYCVNLEFWNYKEILYFPFRHFYMSFQRKNNLKRHKLKRSKNQKI